MTRAIHLFAILLWISGLVTTALAPEECSARLLHRHAAAATGFVTALNPSPSVLLRPDECRPHDTGWYRDDAAGPPVTRGALLGTPSDGRDAVTANGAAPASSAEHLANIIAAGLEAFEAYCIGWERSGDDVACAPSTTGEEADDALDALCFAFIAALRAADRGWTLPDAGEVRALVREEVERAAQLCETLLGHLSTPASRLHVAARLLCPSDVHCEKRGEKDSPALRPVLTQLAAAAAPATDEERCWLSPTQTVSGLLATGLVAAVSFAALCSWLPSLRRIRSAGNEVDALLS